MTVAFGLSSLNFQFSDENSSAMRNLGISGAASPPDFSPDRLFFFLFFPSSLRRPFPSDLERTSVFMMIIQCGETHNADTACPIQARYFINPPQQLNSNSVSLLPD